MKIIAKHSDGLILSQDTFQISDITKREKAKNPAIIDGTLGVLNMEDGAFHTFKTVKEILFNAVDSKIYAYTTSDGGPEYREAVLNWVFRDYKDELLEVFDCKVVATPGGTGAISASMFSSLDAGQTVLIPNLCWSPYFGIAEDKGLKIKKFTLLKDGKFNVDGFIEKANEIVAEQKKLVAIINNPCNNPTGYSMSDAEVEAIVDYLNSLKGIPCVLIYDIAYIDFSNDGMDATRKQFKLFEKINDNILISVCFSASKTFSIYGMRLGAQVFLSKNKQAVTDFYNASNFTARNNWSNCNTGAVNLLVAIDQNEELKNQFLEEFAKVIEMLKVRAGIFLKEAEEVGLKINPYHSGFFITIPTNHCDEVIEKLKKEKFVYLLAFGGNLRIAICSLPAEDIKGLAKKIKDVLKEFGE